MHKSRCNHAKSGEAIVGQLLQQSFVTATGNPVGRLVAAILFIAYKLTNGRHSRNGTWPRNSQPSANDTGVRRYRIFAALPEKER